MSGITFRVNGAPVSYGGDPARRLLDFLREDLGLTGAKEGCGIGECGACTVLLDGRPVNACLVPMFQVRGEVVTVEGLGRPGQLHPVQDAFVRHGAVQCGYCTPGMVVTGAAMLGDRLARSREEIRQKLSGNVCRCTGYQQIVDAIEDAGRGGGGAEPPPPCKVGESTRRVDAEAKVTGTCQYTADIPLPPGCLHGATVRSACAHGRLLDIKVDDALAMPGVVRVLTWRDFPGELHGGNAVPDQPALVKDHIRFYGEAVAVVLADTQAHAREAAERVELVVEALPAVTSPEAALADGAPAIHPEGNLLTHLRLRKGSVEAAFSEAPVVVERRYQTGSQEHLCLETEVALAAPEGDGLVVRAPSQNVFFDRYHICKALGLGRKQVRVIQAPTGAAFGGREDIYAQVHAALGAMVTGRPVRISWSREETQVATTKRHPAVMRYRVAATREGRILALSADVLFDTGAYASWAPNIARKALVHAAGPYSIDNVEVDVRMAYTNNGISGAFRGFGASQVIFACESLLDELALALGMDPAALRRANHLRVGSRTATGQLITGSCGISECTDRALAEAERLAASRPPPEAWARRGMGHATVFYGIGYGNAIPDIGSATAELNAAGQVEVRCGAIDYGQGSLTLFHQLVGEVLGIGVASIRVFSGDSSETPDSGSTVASRQTYVSGEAVRQALEKLKATLVEVGAGATGQPPEALVLGEGGLSTGAGDTLLGWAALHRACQEAGVRPRRQARFKATTTRLDSDGQGDAYWPYAFACHVAEVEVDTRTGQVRVLSLVAAHDVGRAMNPAMLMGQVLGGVAQGLGYALLEAHVMEDGVPATLNMDTYRVPGPCDVPEVLPILVEDPEPTGPFGAKGVGEPVFVAVAPAVVNAVAAATGVRLRELPVRPEVLLPALGGGAPERSEP